MAVGAGGVPVLIEQYALAWIMSTHVRGKWVRTLLGKFYEYVWRHWRKIVPSAVASDTVGFVVAAQQAGPAGAVL